MDKQLTLGSLFDGSGGFPLGAFLNGITPVWASEIEPFPIRVTTKRLPFVKHYGDISSISGADIEPVDIITFGSPCTDMSVAGKRAGLGGKQSVLFYEAIRIIKKMREATDGEYPRYIVWENVPGALSSGKGEDFRCVLEQIAKVKDEAASVPMPPKGKWQSAGEIVGDGYSVAWRILDAQFWGVAQRRRRIYLVADFADGCAGEILFESEGLSGYTPKSFGKGQGIAGNAEDRSGETVRVLNDMGGSFMSLSEDVSATLRAEEHGHQSIVFEPGAVSRLGGHLDIGVAGTLRADMGDNQLAIAVENHPTDGRVKVDKRGTIQTLTSRMGTGGMNVPLVMNERQYALTVGEDIANTLTGTDYKGTQCVCEKLRPKTLKIRSGCEGGGKGALIQDDKSATLSCNNDQTLFVAYSLDRASYNQGRNAQYDISIREEQAQTLVAKGPHAVSQPGSFYPYMKAESQCFRTDGKSNTLINGTSPGCHNGLVETDTIEPRYTVRRLTPTECALLQGLPENWCEGLETDEPTEEEISFFADVFETHRRIMGTSSKPKSRSQIIKWLRDPHSDAAEYKMWGNGVALPCVRFVLAGIRWATQKSCK